ncbi:MAG: DUF4080 domain-containing protein [Syntrophomonas sp.]|uniref:B12-binding domain-containing radical SAM protein n=1 Tax=Syntrophomonas sp. TaxID=2053627 RepID=UPI002613752A|nr:B12-binding domain-containing radical SAM protein [Syntrophomonas sp.]MDD2509948.1 DUF4080 domain-containing protein [Syntrophomonas sp.]MDD3879613.1 DUF4080 domain-containing protein [Syntrophomonas sp.]MDD4626028.1 DUF4080 domain-containing protein [Syntrophomonas sp.]
MKLLLTTLNAKYIHSCLALAYLQAAAADDRWETKVREFTINEKNEYIMAEIFREQPDVLAFSVYIWNVCAILEICREYKKVAPQSYIILGGPEVSYDAKNILMENPSIDCIIRGEGEESIKEVLESIAGSKSRAEVKGISYRDGASILDNPDRELIAELGMVPFPYQDQLDSYHNRILYYETSRGCPYNCSYCLSSTIKGVRFFPLDRVKEDLAKLIHAGVKEVKFVDRTFNADERRARAIMEFIISQGGNTRFHCEIAADYLSPEFISFLTTVPPDLFNFEIGIQSTCPESLKAVRRKSNWQRLRTNIESLQSAGNLHLHLDLIAGLPYESLERFGRSFNDVFSIRPDVIQLGFLKLLKGSEIRAVAREHGYMFQDKPPYQLLANHYLDYTDILQLKQIENLLDRYYNSGQMRFTLDYIVQQIYQGDAFSFLAAFASYWQEQGYFACSHRREAEYNFLLDFIKSNFVMFQETVNELLKYDYLWNQQSSNLPSKLSGCNPENTSQILYTVIKDQDFVQSNLPPYASTKSNRELRRLLHLEFFKIDLNTGIESSQLIPYLFLYNPRRKKAEELIKVPGTFINSE